MSVRFVTHPGSAKAGELKHGHAFTFGGKRYLRVDSRPDTGRDKPDRGYLNTSTHVLVVNLESGRLSFFCRETPVREIEVEAFIL